MPKVKHKRIVLKISGEGLQGNEPSGISLDVLRNISNEIKDIRGLDIEAGVVVGGGNIFRGADKFEAFGFNRAVADYMGMLATVMNALALQNALEQLGIPTRVMTAIEMRQIAEPYIRRRALRHLEKGRVLIFAAGTGNPYFTTDTAAALRAAELGADLIIKATKVDGVYSADPVKYRDAKKYSELSYSDVIRENLKVMDITAITMCMENSIPIWVLSLNQKGAIVKALSGGGIGTIIK